MYDLSPEWLGAFAVVVCGTLLLHLKSPFAALEAIHSVTGEVFMSAEQIDVPLSLTSRNRAALHLEGDAGRWFIANSAGHRRFLEIAGFDIERVVHPYVVPFGAGHPPVSFKDPRSRVRALATRALCGDHYGVPHSALLTRRVPLG